MVLRSGRKPIMALYSGTNCTNSHSVRLVLQEKEVECQIVMVDNDEDARDLAELNPYAETPTLLDRELVLYDQYIINEYLDERLPHPPMMPVDPVNRARARLMIMRLRRDWTQALTQIQEGTSMQARKARGSISDGLIAMSPIFQEQDYLLGEEYSLVDCYLAPLLWRLPVYNIKLPTPAKSVLDYANRLFDRPAFQGSLTEEERDLREA